MLDPFTSFTQTFKSPSSTTVPAYTYPSGILRTGVDSPVNDAWLTIASPSTTTPSNGIIFPICMWTISLASISLDGTKISWSSSTFHTLSIFKDMLFARSSTDFLCVHSSRISPIPSKNMIEDAVLISLRMIDTPIAVPSSTGTSILPWASVWIPSYIYFKDLITVIPALNGYGNNNLFP